MSTLSPEANRCAEVAALALTARARLREDPGALLADLRRLGWTGAAPSTAQAATAVVEHLRREAALDRADAMRADAEAGLSTAQIASRHGVAPSTARAATLGIGSRRGGPPPTLQERILRDVRQGGPCRVDVLVSTYGTHARQSAEALVVRGLLVYARERSDRGFVRIVRLPAAEVAP